MKKLHAFFFKYIQHLDIIDWFLLLFMTVLMLQTIFNLFFNESIGNTSTIDTAIRTTTASLFGYYIGKGFMEGSDNSDDDTEKQIVIIPEDLSLKQKSIIPKAISLKKKDSDELNARRNIQIIIVGTLGISSLIILIITRNTGISATGNVATVSQLRDFVSGSTGFLISQSKR